MKPEYFEQYLACDARGQKSAASTAVRAFIASFESELEREHWVRANLPVLRKNRHSRIRHELFEQLVFPVLKRGAENDDVDSLLWLGKLIQNLYTSARLSAELGDPTDTSLFRRAVEISPQHVEARRLLLDAEVEWLASCMHEWPTILMGNTAANLDGCRELHEELATLRKMDVQRAYVEFLNDFEGKLRDYEARLSAGVT